MGNRTFKIFLIKPSHYDDDGYVDPVAPLHHPLE